MDPERDYYDYHEHTPRLHTLPAAPTSAPPQHGDSIDMEATLTALYKMARAQSTAPPLNEEAIAQYEKSVARAARWGGWVWGVLAVVGVVFSGGVAYSVFMGANATDSEVDDAVHLEMTEHNGGLHPRSIDPSTHRLVGDHPGIRTAIEAVGTCATNEGVFAALPK